MQFLLVGFTEQAQNALEILIHREFTEHRYHSVPRQISQTLYPIFPEIAPQHLAQSDVCIVDLDGIGMPNFNIQYQHSLLKLIGHKPAILISRTIHHWQQHVSRWTSAQIEYIAQPYSRENVIVALQRIFSAGGSKKAKPCASLTSQVGANHEIAPIVTRTKFAKLLLEQRWLQFSQNTVLNHLMNIFSQNTPFKLMIAQHDMLVVPAKNMILVFKTQSVVDYFSLFKSFKLSSFNINAEPVYDDYQNMVQTYVKQGYKPQQLSLFLWQVYQEVLPERLNLDQQGLSLRMNYMPDFSGMSNVPAFMRSVVSSCLNQPQSFDKLREMFSALTEANLNRIFVLAVLCNYADISEFEHCIYRGQKPCKHAEQHKNQVISSTMNQQVVKARKMNLLERLLSKLNW